MLTGGLLPFPRTGCVLYAKAILSYCSQILQVRPRGGMGTVIGQAHEISVEVAGTPIPAIRLSCASGALTLTATLSPVLFNASNAPEFLTNTGEFQGTVVGVAIGEDGPDERQ